MSFLRVFAALVIALVLTREAAAQGNYRGSPQGGRSALMGGTGVALGRDGSIPFLNPAGLTRVDNGTVSFSTNFFSLSHTRYDRFFQPRSGAAGSVLGAQELEGPSYSQNKIDGVPSTLCLYFRLGRVPAGDQKARHMAAACFGSTERSSNDGTALQFNRSSSSYDVSQTQTFNRSFRRFLFGPTYAVRLERWSLGAALHLVATSYSATTSASNIVDLESSTHASTLASSFAGSSYDLALRLGASHRLDRHTTLGISAQLPALHLFGGLQATQTSTTLESGNATNTSLIGSGSFRATPPPSIAAGFGYERGNFRAESDLFFYFPVGPAFASDLAITSHTVTGAAASKSNDQVRIRENANFVVDAAFGLERYILPTFSILGGFSTDFSANPPLAATPEFGSVLWSRGSRAAVSLGVGSYGGAGELLFGTEVSFAQGKAYSADSFANPSQLSLVSQTTWTALFVLAGKTSFAQVQSTVDKVRTLTKPR